MNSYFDFFPQIQYDLDKSGDTILVTDLTRRFKIRDIVLAQAKNFYSYQIKEEERADVIAQKIYNNSKLDWLIFMINDVFDPFWEWPMGYYDFQGYIIGKYGSYVNAVETVHHYEKIVQAETFLIDGRRIPERVLTIDEIEYHTIVDTDRRIVYCYEWEDRINERRKHIKLLDAAFLPTLLNEAKLILGVS